MDVVPRTIWLARHGNRQDFVDVAWRKTAARPDDPGLSPDGLIQAHELGLRLQGEGIDHIFASPFLRTLETAHHIAEVLDLSIKLEAGLGEYIKPRGFHHPPELLSPSRIRSQFTRVDRQYGSLVFPQYPETWRELRQRSQQTIQALLQNFKGHLLLISHAATIKSLARSLTPRASWRDSPFCGFTKLVHHHDHWIIERQRDAAHISQPNRTGDFFKSWCHRAFAEFCSRT
jgi:broad specificity phosphatase PhoE